MFLYFQFYFYFFLFYFSIWSCPIKHDILCYVNLYMFKWLGKPETILSSPVYLCDRSFLSWVGSYPFSPFTSGGPPQGLNSGSDSEPEVNRGLDFPIDFSGYLAILFVLFYGLSPHLLLRTGFLKCIFCEMLTVHDVLHRVTIPLLTSCLLWVRS